MISYQISANFHEWATKFNFIPINYLTRHFKHVNVGMKSVGVCKQLKEPTAFQIYKLCFLYVIGCPS